MSDLIERLRRGDASFYYATMHEAADELERLQRENEELRQRLEIDPRTKYDGIDCRDETIKQLEKELAALKVKSTEPVAREYMFNLMVEGKANEVYDTADEAVRMAMHHVYLSPTRFQEAVDTLKQGQVFTYSYGFSGVDIIPVAKRRINTTPPTATALVEDFKQRAVEVLLKAGMKQGDYEVYAIESLPLINDFNQGETK